MYSRNPLSRLADFQGPWDPRYRPDNVLVEQFPKISRYPNNHRIPRSGKLKVPMKRHAALLPLAVLIAIAAAQTSASTPAPTLLGTKASVSAPRTHFLKSTPAAASATGFANPSHLFKVNDEKGLVLTCIAPEIDANADTDVFKSCTLAPGRTLDDVMHIFVRGIHYEQSQHQREREEWQKVIEEKTAQKQ
jgi:hypothetical protein